MMTFEEMLGTRIGKFGVEELPDNCYDCPFHEGIYDRVICPLIGKTQEDYTGMKRMRGCPLYKITEGPKERRSKRHGKQ